MVEASDARYLERNRIIENYEKKMRELGMLDIDDAEYEEEEAKLTQQMKNSLDTIDQEIEKQAVEIFQAQKQVYLHSHF